MFGCARQLKGITRRGTGIHPHKWARLPELRGKTWGKNYSDRRGSRSFLHLVLPGPGLGLACILHLPPPLPLPPALFPSQPPNPKSQARSQAQTGRPHEHRPGQGGRATAPPHHRTTARTHAQGSTPTPTPATAAATATAPAAGILPPFAPHAHVCHVRRSARTHALFHFHPHINGPPLPAEIIPPAPPTRHQKPRPGIRNTGRRRGRHDNMTM